jgi:hypothetical protein
MFYQPHLIYRDAQGQPLQGGTAIEDRSTLFFHQGLIAWRGDVQIVLENSFRHRGAVEIPMMEFNGGKIVWIVRTPRNPMEAELIVQRAWNDVVNGVKWSLFNNCQDFVSRAYTGENGSKTRNAVFVGGLATAAVFAII